jgi:hypothetical protein
MTDDLFTHAARYPSAPGHRDTDTSREAAKDMASRVTGLRLAVLGALAQDRTADECAAVLGESVLAVRPRTTELKRLGLITDTGERRPNASGKRAIVWRLTL